MKRIAKILTVLGLLALCGPVWAVEVNGPIAHWKFDEGEGTIAYDSAGSNHGTLVNGPVWTTGQIDGALSFDGVDDYVDVGNDSSLKPPLPVTLSAWINLSSLGNWHCIIALDDQMSRYYGIWFAVRSTNNLVISYGDGEGKNSWDRRSKIGTTVLSANTWYHVAAVLRGPRDMDIYINSVDDEGTYGGTGGSLAYSATGHSFIGSNAGLLSYFNGTLDDVQIYDRALSAEEVQQLYLEGLSASERAIICIEDAIDEKVEALDRIDTALEKEYVAHDALEELLESRDYGDLNKRDIAKARQQIHSAIQRQERSTDVLDKSVEELENALTALGWEPEPEPEPVAHWKFDEGEGTIAFDSASNNDGTLMNGPVWTTGQIDGGLSFDGVDDYVDCGNDVSLKPPLPVTLSAWINLSSLGIPQLIITSDDLTSRHYGIWFAVRSANNLVISYGDGEGKNRWDRRSKIGTTVLSANTWYHVAAVVKGPTDMDIYIDGVDDGGIYGGSGGSLAYSASGHSFIGSNSGLASYFNGSVDDVRVYSKALSAEQIQQLYQSGL